MERETKKMKMTDLFPLKDSTHESVLIHMRLGTFLHLQVGLPNQPEHPETCVQCHFIGIEDLIFNPIALRTAKTLWGFDHSEC